VIPLSNCSYSLYQRVINVTIKMHDVYEHNKLSRFLASLHTDKHAKIQAFDRETRQVNHFYRQ